MSRLVFLKSGRRRRRRERCHVSLTTCPTHYHVTHVTSEKWAVLRRLSSAQLVSWTKKKTAKIIAARGGDDVERVILPEAATWRQIEISRHVRRSIEQIQKKRTNGGGALTVTFVGTSHSSFPLLFPPPSRKYNQYDTLIHILNK